MTALLLTADVLDEARRFFEERGAWGCEGTALLARHAAGGVRLVIPGQRAGSSPGCWVEVTPVGKLELTVALGTEERYVARIHSHPGEAFHSRTDDQNPILTQQGALSIVVPYFGLGLRRGLEACAVLVRRGENWIALPPGAERDRTVRVA